MSTPQKDSRERNLEKLYAYVRFALRSGSLVSGYDACVGACLKGTVHVLAVASDLSPRTGRRLANKCAGRVPMVTLGDGSEIEAETGLSNRKILGVTNENLAKAIVKCHEMILKG